MCGKLLGYSALAFRNSMWVIGGALESCDSLNVRECALSAPRNNCSTVRYVGYFLPNFCRFSDVWINTFFEANFMVLEISSSSDVYGAINKIDVTLSLDCNMETGSTIVINGLDAYNQRALNSEIYVDEISSSHFNHIGYWQNSTSAGSILLNVRQLILRGKHIHFSMLFPNLEFISTKRKLSVVASSTFFQRIEQYSWSYQSSTRLPIKIKSRTTHLFANPVVDQPVADICVQFLLERDQRSSLSSSRYASSSVSSLWPSYLDKDTPGIYGFITNYSLAIQRYFTCSIVRIKSFCRNSSCFECNYTTEYFISMASCSAESMPSYGDSVTFVFLNVTDVLVATKIIANDKCYLDTLLDGIGGNFSMNGTEYYTWFRTTCPPGLLNSSDSVLSCSEPVRIFDGGIMFDVDVISNILISSFDIGIPRQIVENKIPANMANHSLEDR